MTVMKVFKILTTIRKYMDPSYKMCVFKVLVISCSCGTVLLLKPLNEALASFPYTIWYSPGLPNSNS